MTQDRRKPRTYKNREQWVLGWRLLLANVLGWKTSTNLMGDASKSPTTKETNEGNNRMSSVYTLIKQDYGSSRTGGGTLWMRQ